MTFLKSQAMARQRKLSRQRERKTFTKAQSAAWRWSLLVEEGLGGVEGVGGAEGVGEGVLCAGERVLELPAGERVRG